LVVPEKNPDEENGPDSQLTHQQCGTLREASTNLQSMNVYASHYDNFFF